MRTHFVFGPESTAFKNLGFHRLLPGSALESHRFGWRVRARRPALLPDATAVSELLLTPFEYLVLALMPYRRATWYTVTVP